MTAEEAYGRLRHLHGDRAIEQMARILAEAKAEGWEDATRFLHSWPYIAGREWGDVLAANRPSLNGREEK